jgi:hypothetical protein
VLCSQVGFESLRVVGSIAEVQEAPGVRCTSPVQQVEKVPGELVRCDDRSFSVRDPHRQPHRLVDRASISSLVSSSINTPGCDVFIAPFKRIPEPLALHRYDLVTELHEAQGVSDDLGLRRVVAFLDLARLPWLTSA